MAGESIANRESATQCVNVARQAAKSGDLAKALRLLDKSLRLYPTDEARTLQSALTIRSERLSSEQSSSTTRIPSPRTKAKTQAAQEHGPLRGAHTAEEQTLSLKVSKMTCFYSRLGLAKGSTLAEVKKSYKRRAFQFHPDKNHSPAAPDAFKAVNEAYEVLSKEDTKAHYDQYGPDLAPQYSQHRHQTRHGFHDSNELTPDDLLNMFFNNAARTRRPTSTQSANRAQATHSTYAQLFQFIPVLLLVLFSMLSGPASDERPFR